MAARRVTRYEFTQDQEPVGLAQFSVQVDGLSLGLFAGCEGLSAEYTFEDVLEGGNNAYVYRLPGRVKYQNIKLTRLLCAESAKLATWFSKFQEMRQHRATATITLYSELSGTPICTWTLLAVHPVKWTGPTFAADGTGVAKETLEIAHHGFLWEKK